MVRRRGESKTERCGSGIDPRAMAGRVKNDRSTRGGLQSRQQPKTTVTSPPGRGGRICELTCSLPHLFVSLLVYIVFGTKRVKLSENKEMEKGLPPRGVRPGRFCWQFTCGFLHPCE